MSGSSLVDIDVTLTGRLRQMGEALVYVAQNLVGTVRRSLGEWMLDRVSVKDFGAKGDGITNDLPAITAALASGASVIFFPEGDYRLPDGQYIDHSRSGKRIVGAGRDKSRILFNHDHAIYQRAGLLNPFTDFVYDTSVSDIGFKTTNVVPRGFAIVSYNVRRCTVERIRTEECIGWRVDHAVVANGTYDLNTGTATIDPAVVAGFSPTDPTHGLNSELTCKDVIIRTSVPGGFAFRFQFAMNVTVDNVDADGCNISWWGGGAIVNQGGALPMLRRVRHVSISNCRVRLSNGGIYGNCGYDVKIVNSTVRDILDVGIDFEGCYDSSASNCRAIDCGNAGLSMFYAAEEVVFDNCHTIQSGKAASTLFETTTSNSYTSSTSVVTAVDNGAGLYRISISVAREWRTGQKIRVGTVVYAITRIDGQTYDLQGSNSSDGTVVAGSTIRFQLGSGSFWVRTTGFSGAGERGVDPIIRGGTHKWTAPEGHGQSSPGNQGTFVVDGAKFINSRLNTIPQGGANQGGTQTIAGCTLQLTQSGLQAASLMYVGGPSLQGKLARIRDNTIIIEAAQLPGTYGINAEASVDGSFLELSRNKVVNTSGTPLDADIRFGSILGITGAAAKSVIEVNDNTASTLVDRSVVTRTKVRYRGNTKPNGDPLPDIGTAGAPTPPASGGWADGTKLEWASHAAGGTEGLIAIGSGDAMSAADAWAASTDYAFAAIKHNGGRIYYCLQAGTSAAAGGPTGTGSNITDGGARWQYKGPKVDFKPYGSIAA